LEGRLELVQRERDGWNGAVGVQALTRDFDAIGAEAYVGRTEIQELGLFTVQRVDRDTYGFEGGLRFDRRRLDNIAFGERDFTNVSTSGGVFVRPSEGVFLGVSAARNERAPDEAELFANGVHVATGQAEFGGAAQGLEFDSEVALSLEGSAHFERGRFDADAHVFVVKYDGFIDLRPNGELFGEDEEHDHEDEAHEGADEHGHEGEHDHGHEEGGVPVFNYVQTDADFYGFELEAGYDLFARDGRKIRLEGAADYVRGDTDLGPPARIPPWSVTGRLVYASEPINARVEVRRVGEQDRVAEFELPTDGYTLLNAFLSYKPFRGARGAEGVTLFLEGRNLTDEEAREHASFLKDLAPLPGRNLRAGVAWRF
jgi:iron complex outermembrane receptor protein